MSDGQKKWVFQRNEGNRYIYADGRAIMCDMQYYPWCPDDDSDWHLIAAAPDLLSLAELARDDLGPWLSAALEDPDSCAEFKEAITNWMTANDRVIRKAKGE